MHDALTGLANRKRLVEHDGRWPARRPSAPAAPIALFLLDLDRFKEINDTLGHHTGDRLLEIVANRLARAVRPEDTVARLGGDEFAVLLTDVSDAGATRSRLPSGSARVLSEPFHLDGMTAAGRGEHRRRPAPGAHRLGPRLLQRADVAMYQAKEERTGVELYRPERDIHTPDRLGLLGSLRRAIENGELELHYQPKVVGPRRAGRSASRRWCAGTTRSAAWSPRTTSSPWPSSPA